MDVKMETAHRHEPKNSTYVSLYIELPFIPQ